MISPSSVSDSCAFNSHLPKNPQGTVRPMQRTVWGALQRTFWEAKAICCKEPKKTNVSYMVVSNICIYLLFSPLFGEDFQFDEHIFQMGRPKVFLLGSPQNEASQIPKRLVPKGPSPSVFFFQANQVPWV